MSQTRENARFLFELLEGIFVQQRVEDFFHSHFGAVPNGERDLQIRSQGTKKGEEVLTSPQLPNPITLMIFNSEEGILGVECDSIKDSSR